MNEQIPDDKVMLFVMLNGGALASERIPWDIQSSGFIKAVNPVTMEFYFINLCNVSHIQYVPRTAIQQGPSKLITKFN